MKIEDVLVPTICATVVLVSIGYLHDHYANKREVAAYQEGFEQAAKLHNQPLTEDQKAMIAVKWWTDSNDMKAARQRLCSNVSSNALKGSK